MQLKSTITNEDVAVLLEDGTRLDTSKPGEKLLKELVEQGKLPSAGGATESEPLKVTVLTIMGKDLVVEVARDAEQAS